jgi:hypothetical protein
VGVPGAFEDPCNGGIIAQGLVLGDLPAGFDDCLIELAGLPGVGAEDERGRRFRCAGIGLKELAGGLARGPACESGGSWFVVGGFEEGVGVVDDDEFLGCEQARRAELIENLGRGCGGAVEEDDLNLAVDFGELFAELFGQAKGLETLRAVEDTDGGYG